MSTPFRCTEPYDWHAILRLIQTEFADMEGRINPPSSMYHLTIATIAQHALTAEVWAIGTPPVACAFFTAKPESLYIGKLAVAKTHRGQGLARRLLAAAETRARALGLPALELQTRVELVENHATFRALGFRETGRSSHPGYAHPTTITFRRDVFPAARA